MYTVKLCHCFDTISLCLCFISRCLRSLTPDTVEDVSPAPRVVCQELGVLYGRLTELAPQVCRGLKQAPKNVSQCIVYIL